ncbi:hypothetical protein NDU88_009697 [Pleurodeles waltl]|uniref:Uncharacterized protein n=1 Tax=Pleurodeles waltl TaxID=8319 RepID=A0AAV7QY22_PLEWA|nr:hypothetical protein NDU88_009697 [Pleurodeles waltl]
MEVPGVGSLTTHTSPSCPDAKKPGLYHNKLDNLTQRVNSIVMALVKPKIYLTTAKSHFSEVEDSTNTATDKLVGMHMIMQAKNKDVEAPSHHYNIWIGWAHQALGPIPPPGAPPTHHLMLAWPEKPVCILLEESVTLDEILEAIGGLPMGSSLGRDLFIT